MKPQVPCPACSEPMERDLVVCWPCWRAVKGADDPMVCVPVSEWPMSRYEAARDSRVREDRAAMKQTTRHEA